MALHIVVGMDKFKGTLSSRQASSIVGDVFRRQLGAEVRCFSLADGGEGTCEALTLSRGGQYREVEVHDPLGRPVTARYGYSGDSAFMEMASASGLVLLSSAERNPLLTSSYGFGEMLADAVRHGAREIVAGLGGSATNDGGAGMAEALGAVFRDRSGAVMSGLCGGRLAGIGSMELSGVRSLLQGIRLRLACDVTNPLVGREGASAVYGPQKGGTANMIRELDHGLAHLQAVSGHGGECHPGDGAAGGLGFGCRVFCGGEFQSGARLIMEESGFLSALSSGRVDMVITGEGCTDAQTDSGKLCRAVADAAHALGLPCVLLSGGLGCDRGHLLQEYDGVFMSGVGRQDLGEVLSHAEEDLASAATSVARVLELGMRAGHSR